jgi:nucleoid DNA-binding protein
MLKKDIIKTLNSMHSDLLPEEASCIVDEVLNFIMTNVANDKKLEIRGFMSLAAHVSPSRRVIMKVKSHLPEDFCEQEK